MLMGSKRAAKWELPVAAFLGVFAGIASVVAHEAHCISLGHFFSSNPFLHILGELAVFSAGGATLFVAIAEMHNRLGQRCKHAEHY